MQLLLQSLIVLVPVTNQAIQVLQGPYITNTYGGGVQCQGPTRNFTPYVTGTASASKPWEPYFNDPVYDISDNSVLFDADGNEIGDGIIDNPGDILFHKKTRTGQKDNFSLGIGFSMTWSTPLDKELQDQCKQAAATQISLQQQLMPIKRLDFEIARLKNCGQLMQNGIMFKPGTKYAAICADVMVINKNAIAPHVHSIPSPSKSESPYSSDAVDLGAPLRLSLFTLFPRREAIFFITFFTVGPTTFKRRSATGFASSAEVVATTAILAVVVTIPALGMLPMI